MKTIIKNFYDRVLQIKREKPARYRWDGSMGTLELVLKNFETKYPNDDRPRKAIEAAKEYLNHPSESTRRAARSAAVSAESAAWCAARSAARSAASAESAAWCAAISAARSNADECHVKCARTLLLSISKKIQQLQPRLFIKKLRKRDIREQ